MVHQRITCDRCGETIDEDRTALKAICGARRHQPPTDLCHDCRLAFEAFLGLAPRPDLTAPLPTARSRPRTPSHVPAAT